MFLAMMSGCRQEVRAVRAELIDERCKAQPDPQRIKDLEVIERRAMEALVAGQLVWGSYWAISDLWFGAGSMTRGRLRNQALTSAQASERRVADADGRRRTPAMKQRRPCYDSVRAPHD